MEKKTLGAFIAVLRRAKGLTQKQLAEMLNVSDKAVSRWERDECAPDLSLIPVLAEIFDISADELLRGQRKTADDPITRYETQKTDKQLRYLLKKKATDFAVTTCAAIAVALFGLVAAMISNLGFLRAYIGFFASCFFFIPAVLCQVVSLVWGLQSLDAEELEEKAGNTRRSMILLSELSISVTACLFAACLPLIVLVSDAYAGLSAHSWAGYGLLWGTVAALVCAAVCSVINRRLGYRLFPALSSPKNKLRIRCSLILAAVLFATCIAHVSFHLVNYANLHWLAASTKWETWDELKEYLETPMTDDGQQGELVSTHNTGYVDINTYQIPDGSTFDITERTSVLVYEEDMNTPKYECVLRNQSVDRYYFSSTQDHLPIYTLTYDQVNDAEDKLALINTCLCSVYILEIAIGIFLYRRKAKRLETA